MRVSYNWLKDYVEFSLTPQQVADKLTMAGLEVEGLEYLGEGIDGVIVGRIAAMKPHPSADRLTLCDVETGSEVLPIVCGAKNMKEGDKVPLALVGASLPGGVKIHKGTIRGVTSFGMLCSDKELGLAKESSGLLILPEDTQVGEQIVKTLGLDDWALEINVTANRPDCLSTVGIAREVAALTRHALKLPKATLKQSGEYIGNLIKIEVEDEELCPRYAGRVIQGVKVGPSPAWMQRRLQAVGMRPINNIVDVTNYVMMELGHPLHAFDYGLVRDRKIIIRGAAEGEMFTTLDGVERRLDPGMLLICDGMRPVALAGVMGGRNSEVMDSTADLFIESAYFDPGSVRRTSKKLGLHTEASHRFERGADPEGLITALDRAAALIAELAGGKVSTGRADEYPAPITMPEVTVSVARVNALLGVELEKKEMLDILKRLKITFRDDGGDTFTALAPTYRPDLTREADMVEEIARIHGYGRIKAALPAFVMTPGLPDKARDASSTAKETLKSLGFNEVVNYSFMDPADFDRFRLPEGDFRRKVIRLQNPLTSEQSVMRTTLAPSLMANLAWNFSRGVRDLKVFEVSRVFLSVGPGLPEEPVRVAALATGSRTGSFWDGHDGSVDFFDLKGAADALLGRFNVEGAMFKPATDVPFLHPGKAAWLMLGGRQAGWLGQVHPDVMASYDVPMDAFIMELELHGLLESAGGPPSFRQLPKYPAVERDVAAILSDDVPSYNVLKAIESLKLALVEDVRLFDHYSGKQIPAGKKSLAYKITYRSADRTLTDEEVNSVHQQVMQVLKDRLGAEIREQ